MSTTPTATAPPPAPLAPLPPLPPTKQEITLISHSMLFYWWPIWVLGAVFAIWTGVEDHRLAIVPDGSKLTKDEKLSNDKETVYHLSVTNPPTKSLQEAEKATTHSGEGDVFRPRVSQRPWMGPIFCVVLLITVVITNVPLRGLWSMFVILVLILLVLAITVTRQWDHLLAALFGLHIYINMAGYLFIAAVTFVLWAVAVFIFDQRTYMTVNPGQVRICEHIGASIRNIDATGIEFEKQRDDLFRHWLLGFFSGDVIIHLPDKQQIRLPNVLGIDWRLTRVQELLREKAVTTRV